MDFSEINETLSPSQITVNSQQRFAAKMMLNKFLGHFLLNESKFQETLFVKSRAEVLAQFNAKKLLGIQAVTKDICQLSLKKQLPLRPNRKSNSFVGGYVLAYARNFIHDKILKLYEVGIQPLYCDCDAIYYKKRPAQTSPIPIGYAFGEFQPIYKSNITSFVALGKKSYSVQFQDTNGAFKSDIKVSGFSFQLEEVKSLVPHERFISMIKSMVKNELQIYAIPQTIHKVQGQRTVNKDISKKFSNMYFRARKLESSNSFSTVPYGYKK